MGVRTGDPRRREVRIAPVMTGGTSLAVWMGGVTSELYSLLRHDEAPPGSTAEIYHSLVDLTSTDPVVDVVTGTSAGGLNGCLLSVAVCLDLPLSTFAELRSTLMTTADLSKLLRPADESDPPSLLQGTIKFENEIASVLQEWASDTDWAAAMHPIDLVTTYTAITPVAQGRVDDFGEPLTDVTHAGTLRFSHRDFDDPDVLLKIASAAKTSAGIPGVFEPSYLPSGPADAAVSGRQDLASHKTANFRDVSRWAVDGGLVVNLPLGEALDRIFQRPANGIVRRVILYVCPTPQDQVDNSSEPAEPSPSILASALTVISAPRAEGITGDIDELRRHNAGVHRQLMMRRSMASIHTAIGDGLEAATYPGAPESLFDVYRKRRTESSIDHVVERRRQAVGASDPGTDETLRNQLRGRRLAVLPTNVMEFSGGDRPWGWGIAPIEEAASVVLGVVSRGLQLDAYRRGVDAAEQRAKDVRFQTLAQAKTAVHAALETINEVRALDQQFWADELAAESIESLEGVYQRWPYAPESDLQEDIAEASRVVVFDNLRSAHHAIASAFADAWPVLREIALSAGAVEPTTAPGDDAPEPPQTDPGTAIPPGRRAAAQALDDELRMLGDQATSGIEDIQRRLLQHHVIATLLLDEVISREQPSELMQVSWNAANSLDPQRSPDNKLVGTELARLGAFLKPSWRANDWFWGRMDGASRLARLLLDPRRLFELGVTSATVLETLGIDDPDGELSFLDGGLDAEVPKFVPATTQRLIERLQLGIAREELPKIADAIEASNQLGGNEPDGGLFRNAVRDAFAGGPPPDERIAELVTMLDDRFGVGADRGRVRTHAHHVGTHLRRRSAGNRRGQIPKHRAIEADSLGPPGPPTPDSESRPQTARGAPGTELTSRAASTAGGHGPAAFNGGRRARGPRRAVRATGRGCDALLPAVRRRRSAPAPTGSP